MKKIKPSKDVKELSRFLVLHCFRNTYLERLHAGIVPSSKSGDYEDVNVVSPYGPIPWKQLSRIDDDEMKKLIKEVVNRLYTALHRLMETGFLRVDPWITDTGFRCTVDWDQPEIDEGIKETIDFITIRMKEKEAEKKK